MASIGERAAMRWVKRGLWLAAWSFWLWLGVGLYRELPRDLGRLVRTLSLAQNEQVLGFDRSSHNVVTRIDSPLSYRLVDAQTGEELGRPVGNDLEARTWESCPNRQDGPLEYLYDQGWFLKNFDWPDDWATIAVRWRDTGELFSRRWSVETFLVLYESEDGAFAANGDGSVYLGWSVNWPLLALCQTILALPLVLLWAVLRWWQKRRLRLASVAP